MKSIAKFLKNVGLVAILLSIAHASHAQVLEEVVVTAQKRAESIQDVPIAMAAFTGDTLVDLGAQTAVDIIKFAPNLDLNCYSAANCGITIRAVGTGDFFANGPGSVGIYVDEVSSTSPYLAQGFALYDMERVEVLRGPQNALFGRNTTGGAINYISRKPDTEAGLVGYVSGTYGTFDRLDLEGAINVPLNETTAFRLAGKTQDQDGAFNNLATGNDYGQVDRQSFRAQLLWAPNEVTEVLANIHHARDRSQSTPFRVTGVLNTTADAFGSPTCTDIPGAVDFTQIYNCVNFNGDNPSTDNWSDIYRYTNDRNWLDYQGAFIKVSHMFGDYEFTSITAYDENETQYSHDEGGANPEMMHMNQVAEYEQFSQEIRVASPAEDKFRWIGGLFYFTEDSSESGVFRHPPQGIRIPIPAIDPSTAFFAIADMSNDVLSVYGQAEYDFTDRLTLTLGGRFTNDQKDLNDLTRGRFSHAALPIDQFFGPAFIFDQVAGLAEGCVTLADYAGAYNTPCRYSISDEATYDQFGGKIGLDFQLTDDTLLYGSFSRGFKSGKFDIEFFRWLFSGPDVPLREEVLQAFEVGLKSTLLGGKMTLNGAAFAYDWEDFQTFALGPNGPAFVNVPEVRIKGVEIESQINLNYGVFVSVGASFVDSEITDNGGLGDVDQGRPLQGAPEWSYNIMAIKETEFGSNLLKLQLAYSYKDGASSAFVEIPLMNYTDDRGILDARATLEFGQDSSYKLSVFGENLTEDENCINKSNHIAFSGSVTCLPNVGQTTWGVSLTKYFE